MEEIRYNLLCCLPLPKKKINFFPNLREFVGFFPGEGLARVIKSYLASALSPFPQIEEEESSSDEEDGGVRLNPKGPLASEDILLLMTDGIEDAKESALAHRLVGDYYLFLEEYESAVETARNGLKLLEKDTPSRHQSR